MQLRGAVARRVRRARLRGDAVECPCCGRTWSAFAPASNRGNAICPGCGSHERHRVLWIYLRDHLRLGSKPLRLLHFAPEYALRAPISGLERIDYVTADLDPAGVDVEVDITDMPFADGEFGAVLCSHVLEHVLDDRAAMAELVRVVDPEGWAIVLVPIDEGLGATHEDPEIRAPEERLRAFGQADHVRMYAPDVEQRLLDAGFSVEPHRLAAQLPAERFGLLPGDVIFHCSHPSSS